MYVCSSPVAVYGFPNMLPIAKNATHSSLLTSSQEMYSAFVVIPQDVNLSINLQRAAAFSWHLTTNKDQTAVSPPS